ncbi:hypothetical protein TNCV_2053591 [Trichonephila clavipes]|nr:hypothetical protein TNCV_2053591 [Trichonephila clavipes]
MSLDLSSMSLDLSSMSLDPRVKTNFGRPLFHFTCQHVIRPVQHVIGPVQHVIRPVQHVIGPPTWEVERGKFYDPVRSLLKSKNQEINRLQLAVKLPWAIFFESVDILS